MKVPVFPRMHVSLYVKDILATASFYSRFFGTSPSKLREDYCKFELEAPGLIISFVQNAKKVNSQFGHLGIQIGSEAELKKRLSHTTSQQVAVWEEMGTNCCYAHQDKYWVSDPDGHMWEVYYFHEDVAFNDPRHQVQEATACCTPATEVAPDMKEARKPRVPLSEAQTANENACTPASGCC